MKIKLLTLLIVITGIIIISGCVDSEKQPPTSKAQDSLYKDIFYPYSGMGQGSHPNPGSSPENPIPDPSEPGSIYDLNQATSMLDRNIQQADIIILKLETAIQRQKAEGKNVSRVETLLEKYKLLIIEAKKYRALADNVTDENNSSAADSDLENRSSEDLKKEYLIESQNSMIQANEVMKEIFVELQHLIPGNEELNATSRLSATGNGMVNLMGNFTLNMHVEEGEMAIPDLSEDSLINITGDYTFEEKTDMHGDIKVYHMRSADVNISGSRKAVMLRGKNITFTAEGEGFVTFLGNGTYRIEEAGELKKEQNWPQPLFNGNPGEQRQKISGDEPGIPGEHGPDGKNYDKVIQARERNNITEVNNVSS